MIIRHRAGIFALTTAATVWLVAALDRGVATALVLLILLDHPQAAAGGRYAPNVDL